VFRILENNSQSGYPHSNTLSNKHSYYTKIKAENPNRKILHCINQRGVRCQEHYCSCIIFSARQCLYVSSVSAFVLNFHRSHLITLNAGRSERQRNAQFSCQNVDLCRKTQKISQLMPQPVFGRNPHRRTWN
jgi:hypothetical protein